jgi:16S rRNA (adenine1518-N6/adenine1519-N6)-dimethyltransferase
MYKNLGSSAAKIADKKFGQNFLKDSSILNQIIEAIPNDGLPLVEIGPGLGDLTRQLIQVGNVRAYEVDKRLCEYLKDEFKDAIRSGSLELVCQDITKHSGSLYESSYSLIANLPYYIATNIILNSLRDSNCKHILVMVQKEVAQKFAASVGDKNFGSLAILSQSIAEVKLLFDVPPTAFEPQPKVTSAILYIDKRDSLKDKGFEKFLKIATKQPRKTIYKNLSSSYDKKRLDELFDALDIKKSARSHELDLSVYHHFYNNL